MSESTDTSLGDFPSDWQVARLADIATKIQDGTHFSPQSTSGPYLYLTSKNVRFGRMDIEDCSWISEQEHRGIYARCDVRYGDVLLTKDGANTGNAALNSLREQFSLLSSVAIIRTDDQSAHSPFVLQYILSSQGQQRLKDMMAGNAITRLTLEKIKAFTLPLPPLPQQRKIARILTTLDNLIEKTEALIAKYQSIKQGMMADLFTRGVDANGKLRPPQSAAPELYKQSELGWIPMEWGSCELSNVVVRAEYGISESLDDTEGVPVLRMNNLSAGRVDVCDIKRSGCVQAQRLLLKNLDVLFNRTNSIEHVGRTSIWREELPLASFASYLVRLIPSEQLIPEYLVYWLNLHETQIAIRQFATPGVHQVNINPTNLRRTLISLPSNVNEQSAICRVVQQQETETTKEFLYLTKLRLQKSGLMQDLLTGKVPVTPDEVEEVATHV